MSHHSRHHNKRRKFHKEKSFHNYSSGCSFCGKNLEGIPHRCKYCWQIHCSEHLLPEDHQCSGINQEKKFGFKKESYASHKSYEDSRESIFSPNQTYKPANKRKEYHYRPKFRFPRIRLPRMGKLLSSFIIAVISYFLAVRFVGNSIFLWIEFFACAYFTTLLFKKPFRWANRVSMADDLAFFGLRIFGGLVSIVGIYLIFAGALASALVKNSAPQTIPYFCIVGGLIVLGGFIAFRTNRRHNVVGFWRA